MVRGQEDPLSQYDKCEVLTQKVSVLVKVKLEYLNSNFLKYMVVVCYFNKK